MADTGQKKAGGTPTTSRSERPAGSGQSRRDKLASFEAERRREQRVRTIRLLVICVVLAMALLAYPVYLFVDDYRNRNATLESLGSPLAAAGCDPVVEHAATGNQEHVDDGTKVTYKDLPPDSGAHYATPAPFSKHFYATADRPAVETLVHNLEHGYTVAWYNADAPKDQIKAMQQVAKTFASDDYDPADKFIAAPWSAADGAPFPAGKNLVLTRWTADPTDPSDTTAQKGVRQSCAAVSGQAIKDFMAKYPATNAPEPNAG